MRFCFCFCFVASAVFASSCAEPNTLTGSISTSHDLSFDTVGLRLLEEQQAYELKYTKDLEGGGEDVVAKLVFDVPEGGVGTDELDLLELDVVVERVTAANDAFPTGLERANATFTAGGNEDGEATTGSFASTFDTGATLNGTFEVTLEVVAF